MASLLFAISDISGVKATNLYCRPRFPLSSPSPQSSCPGRWSSTCLFKCDSLQEKNVRRAVFFVGSGQVAQAPFSFKLERPGIQLNFLPSLCVKVEECSPIITTFLPSIAKIVTSVNYVDMNRQELVLSLLSCSSKWRDFFKIGTRSSVYSYNKPFKMLYY